jgi:hypothetical protein
MHNGKRRIPLIVGMALVAMALAFPVSVAARDNHHDRTIPPDVLGAHTWTGTACDGTALSVAFHVTDRGRLVFDSAAGSATRVRKHHDWFTVRFNGKHVRLVAWVNWRHGTLRLHTRSWSADCPPPADPPADPPPVDDGGNGQSG